MHDLLRLYARQLSDAQRRGGRAGAGQRPAARAATWTPRTAADAHLRALAGMPVPAEFTGRDDALAWLDAERPSLIAAVTMAAEHRPGPDRHDAAA